MQATMIDFIVKNGGAELLQHEFAEMAIQDQFTGLENRLARELRKAEDKPFKTEIVPAPYIEDEFSGSYYNDRALFFKDGTIEVVSYKGEGIASFSSVDEYESYITASMYREPEYTYFREDEEDEN